MKLSQANRHKQSESKIPCFVLLLLSFCEKGLSPFTPYRSNHLAMDQSWLCIYLNEQIVNFNEKITHHLVPSKASTERAL